MTIKRPTQAENDLQNIQTLLRELYWQAHKELSETEHKNGFEQAREAVNLGRLAEAQTKVIEAIAALQGIPRK